MYFVQQNLAEKFELLRENFGRSLGGWGGSGGELRGQFNRGTSGGSWVELLLLDRQIWY
jgi:hypothetical protein